MLEINTPLSSCIALKKMDGKNCEMKRMFVRPEFRGKHIGKLLACKVIDEAKSMGFEYIYLDTLPFLHSAIAMYKKLGFVPRKG